MVYRSRNFTWVVDRRSGKLHRACKLRYKSRRHNFNAINEKTALKI